MKIIKKEGIKKLLLLNAIVVIVFEVIFLCITIAQYKKYKIAVNSFVTNIINKVATQNPDIPEDELIKLLKQEENTNKDILKKYGFIGNDQAYIKVLNKNMNISIITNVTLVIVFAGVIFIVYYRYLLKQEKKIMGVNGYLKELNNKKYDLKIEENNEDEISKLKNELYKITILLKETAEKSENEKEQLKNSLADISHQLKTPLTSIRIMLDMMTENPNMDEEVKKEFLNDINIQIEWISSLVISILKLAKFDAGVIKMNNGTINVEDLINEVIANLSILLELRNIQIIVQCDSKVQFVGDYKWQLEAITNIVKNAIEHSFENSKIYINVEDNKLYTKIRIKDEGKGIEKKDIKHIFERFYREKDFKENNIGIGLALSKTVVEKNNGYINVESEINKGTTFEIKYFK